MINIFQKLEMKVENDIVIPPYFRQDIEQMADLAEEVERFYGYDKLDTTLIKAHYKTMDYQKYILTDL